MTESIQKILDTAVGARVFPGCAFGLVRRYGDHTILTAGRHTYDASSPMVQGDSLYDVASLTKSVVTATLANIFLATGKIALDDQIIKYIPEIQNDYREEIRIKHLLDYTLFYSTDSLRLSSFKDKSARDLEAYIFTRPLAFPPGTKVQQTNTAPFLLGLVIERVSGKALDELGNDLIFLPAGMKDATFFPENFSKERIVPTEIDSIRGVIQGVVNDESAYLFKKEGKVVGQAGLFSSVPSLLSFIEKFLLPGPKIPLGWQYGEPELMGASAGPATFGRTGFTGCSLVCDSGQGVGFVLLSNRTFPNRPQNIRDMNSIRSDLAEIVWKSKP